MLAVPDFRHVLKLDPGNKLAREQLEAAVKLIRRIEFEKVRPVKSHLVALVLIAVAVWKGYRGR